MTDDTDGPPDDDFAATAFARPAFDFDEVTGELLESSASDPPVSAAEVQARQEPGPAWAGTLPGTDPVPVPRRAAPEPYVPPTAQPEVVPMAAPAPSDPTDLAATSLHQPVHEVPSTEPPIDDLRKLEKLEQLREELGGSTPTSSDTGLKIALAGVVLLIALLILALFVFALVELSSDEGVEQETSEVD